MVHPLLAHTEKGEESSLMLAGSMFAEQLFCMMTVNQNHGSSNANDLIKMKKEKTQIKSTNKLAKYVICPKQ